MKVSKIYTYPIKSLRAVECPSAELTRHGLPYDRRFMLLRVQRGGNDANNDPSNITYKNMTVGHVSECVLFFPTITFPSAALPEGKLRVEFRPPVSSGQATRSIELPLVPDVAGREEVDVDLYRSVTKGYRMDDDVCGWFSECFGYEVILAYLGENLRGVRMSTSSSGGKPAAAASAAASGGFLWSMLSKASEAVLGSGTANGAEPERITFADCAPYLVVSDKSMDDVHNRLPAGDQMDITKFRPNIIVTGAEEPWEEDYWGELSIGEAIKLECAQNCARCQSINIDYATGKQGEGEAGKMLKKLQSNRRVDLGMKYSPVFGRYSFLHPSSGGRTITVGDEVVVSRRNDERTRFDWDSICTK